MRAGPTILIALALSAATGPVRARDTQSPHAGSLSVGVGTFNMRHANTSSGVGLEYRLDSRPWFAVGAYERNGDIDLGGPVEFRTSLDVSRALRKGVRVGVTLYHLSNARLYDRNPGVNALAFVQTF